MGVSEVIAEMRAAQSIALPTEANNLRRWIDVLAALPHMQPAGSTQPAPVYVRLRELSPSVIEQGWRETFSTTNPFCPCDIGPFTKAVRWAERALLSAQPSVAHDWNCATAFSPHCTCDAQQPSAEAGEG